MDELMLVEVELRNMRNAEVIKALDRLVNLPATREQLKRALADLNTVQRFIQQLPDQIQHAAKSMFIEHGRLIENHFRTQQGARTEG